MDDLTDFIWDLAVDTSRAQFSPDHCRLCGQEIEIGLPLDTDGLCWNCWKDYQKDTQ